MVAGADGDPELFVSTICKGVARLDTRSVLNHCRGAAGWRSMKDCRRAKVAQLASMSAVREPSKRGDRGREARVRKGDRVQRYLGVVSGRRQSLIAGSSDPIPR